MAGTWRLESRTKNNACFPLATGVVHVMLRVNMDLAFLLDYLYLVTVAHHQTPYGCEEEFVPASVRGST